MTMNLKKLRRRLLGVLLVLVVSGLGAELLVRQALLGDGPAALALARRHPPLRYPTSYADQLTSEFWLLRYRLRNEAHRGKEARHHPDLGWIDGKTDPVTFENRGEPGMGDRRPVILVGDSFAACFGDSSKLCFEDMLARSDLEPTHRMLNYGTGGYGFGQIAMATRAALARHLERRPIVIVSLLPESDLDRTLLGFRSWPKPRFELDSEGRAVRTPRVLPETRDEYLSMYGTGIRSYAWAYLKHGSSIWPESWLAAERRRRFEECRAVNAAVLRELVADLREAEVEFWFLLFHGRSFLTEGSPEQPYEDLIVRELEDLAVPYVQSWRPLREDAARTGRGPDDYWIRRGPGKNHLTSIGNEVVFQCILDGLAGRFHGGTR